MTREPFDWDELRRLVGRTHRADVAGKPWLLVHAEALSQMLAVLHDDGGDRRPPAQPDHPFAQPTPPRGPTLDVGGLAVPETPGADELHKAWFDMVAPARRAGDAAARAFCEDWTTGNRRHGSPFLRFWDGVDFVVPTDESRRRHPPDGRYDGTTTCTCSPNCPADCDGSRCGCRACDRRDTDRYDSLEW